MTRQDDIETHERREAACRQSAARASSDAIRKLHLRLARLHADKARMLRQQS